jgi:hypothetical protein
VSNASRGRRRGHRRDFAVPADRQLHQDRVLGVRDSVSDAPAPHRPGASAGSTSDIFTRLQEGVDRQPRSTACPTTSLHPWASWGCLWPAHSNRQGSRNDQGSQLKYWRSGGLLYPHRGVAGAAGRWERPRRAPRRVQSPTSSPRPRPGSWSASSPGGPYPLPDVRPWTIMASRGRRAWHPLRNLARRPWLTSPGCRSGSWHAESGPRPSQPGAEPSAREPPPSSGHLRCTSSMETSRTGPGAPTRVNTRRPPSSSTRAAPSRPGHGEGPAPPGA